MNKVMSSLQMYRAVMSQQRVLQRNCRCFTPIIRKLLHSDSINQRRDDSILDKYRTGRKTFSIPWTNSTLLQQNFSSKDIHSTFLQQRRFVGKKVTNSNEDPSERLCWSCNAPVGIVDLFCDQCKMVQPPNKDVDYFRYFDKRPYYNLNVLNLKKLYIRMQAQVHPDKFAQHSRKERAYSKQISSHLTKAYKTLSHPEDRALYCLEVVGHPFDPEKLEADTKILTEIWRWNFALEEAESTEDLKFLRNKIYDKMDKCLEKFNREFNKQDYKEAINIMMHIKYFGSLKERLEEKIGTSLLDDDDLP